MGLAVCPLPGQLQALAYPLGLLPGLRTHRGGRAGRKAVLFKVSVARALLVVGAQ